MNRPDLGVWAVADGAGGHADGQHAAKLLAEALEALPPGLSGAGLLAEVRGRILSVHEALHEEATRRSGQVIASTIVVLLARDDHYACLWAGDSRAYLCRDGILTQITRDHTLVQELVDAGIIGEEEAEGHPQANVITRAVGASGELELEKASDRFAAGDRFLLCSDGFSKTVPEAGISALLADSSVESADHLLPDALTSRAKDNVTVVVIDVTDAPPQ